MLVENSAPSSLELVLRAYETLIEPCNVSLIAVEAAVSAMAPATKSAILSDLKCYLGWCRQRRPVVVAIPAEPETLVFYLRWLARGSKLRAPAKAATLRRRIASIARVHRILGFGVKEPLATQAGMVRDTLSGLHRETGQRQRQAAPLRYGAEMAEGQGAPAGITVQVLLRVCGTDIVGLRDAALFSLAYDAGLRVSELVGVCVNDVKAMQDGSGRLEIAFSKTDQHGDGAFAWVSSESMVRLSSWLLASGIVTGPVFRRVNILSTRTEVAGQNIVRHFLGCKALTRQGVVAILRRRAECAVAYGDLEMEEGSTDDAVRILSTHSFRVGLTQDLFAAGEEGAGIALALRWSSPVTALRYARELNVANNAAARVIRNLRSREVGDALGQPKDS